MPEKMTHKINLQCLKITVISDSHFFKSLHKSTSLNAIKITLPEKDDETEVIHSCLREDALTID